MARILVIGDSLAYGKWDSRGGWVARLREYVDQHFNIGKGGNWQVYNLAVPGEIIERLADRATAEIICRIDPQGQNLILAAIGINDTCPNNRLSGKQTPADNFMTALRKIIALAKASNCQLAFIGLAPVDPSKSQGLIFSNTTVAQYDGYISTICKQANVNKLELFDKLLALNFPDYLADSVHPNDDGHKIIFNAVLKFLQDLEFVPRTCLAGC
jgi:lysophospholipase L1-like esterase